MGYSDFPNGITSFGVPVMGGGGLIPFSTGSYFFVNATGGVDNPAYGTKDQPFATIDYAIGKCTANKNDVIIVMPGHAENVSAAGSITADIAGITIVGLGNGLNRPILTFTGTAGTIAVSAANVLLRNIVITAGIDEVVTIANVTAAGAIFDAVDYYESSSSYNCIKFLTTSTAADRLTIKNCWHTQTTAPASNAGWLQPNGCDDLVVTNNKFFINTTNNSSSGIIAGVSTASLRVFIDNNIMVAPGGSSVVPVTMYSGSTGFITRNLVGSGKSAIAASIAGASCYCAENYALNTANASGILDPAADT